MKLTISRAKLAELMAKGGSSAPKISPVPIVQHARLVAEGGRFRVSTTDLNIQAEAVAGVAADAPFATTVDAAKLSLLVNRLARDSEVTLSVVGSDLIVKAGSSRLKLATLPAADWPGLDTLAEESAVFVLTGAELARLLVKPSAAASENANRSGSLASVFLHCREWDGAPRLATVGTNGHVAVVVAVDLPEGAEDMPKNGAQFGVVLSLECVASALRLFKDSESVRITVNARAITFEDAVARLSSKLMEGDYPDYQRIIPAPGGPKITIDRQRGLASIALLETFAAKDQGHKLECGTTDGGMILAASEVGGEGFDTIEAEVEGEVAVFGVSSLYFKTLLGVYTSATVGLSFSEPGRAILVTAEGEPDTVAVLMPMRTSGELARRVAA